MAAIHLLRKSPSLWLAKHETLETCSLGQFLSHLNIAAPLGSNVPAPPPSLETFAIALGAFGAHSLKEKLEPQDLMNFETGVRYMMYHLLALLLVNNSSFLKDHKKIMVSMLFLVGILFFSGSLFVISTGMIGAKQIWFVTPLGGLFFIVGWLITALAFFKKGDEN